MADDLNSPTGTATHSTAPAIKPEADSNRDPTHAIGYEAADPSLHTAFWGESSEASLSAKHLR